ncbi:MFS transporter [Raphidocelis subcapitata]|uniref:MFS transporter n=1 Tax=Raphidocelis subcapitata TaxID=307507 RepID=A0A2V0P382_9CHLO|nr:MFS transporter [Raphidocelis subcapitata]|eukprot:GBF91667.1 MFS transporter [Raphidocelis subcapitata]
MTVAEKAAGAAPAPEAAAPRPFVHPFGRLKRGVMVAAFAAMMALLNADQNLLAPNLTAAANDFGFNSLQKDTYLGGYVMAAFFLVGAPSAILCGYLTDKINRIHLLFVIVVVGHGPCLCTYFVKSFWQFFLLRMLTGVAVGGVIPLVYSLLGDLFPITSRAAMAALVQMAIGGGIMCGQLLAGLLGPATNWRVPYLMVAVPSLLLALAIVLFIKDPPRGAYEEALQHQLAEGGAYEETITWSKARAALRAPSNLVLILQAVPGCLPWGVIGAYLNDYFSQDKGFSVAIATVIIIVFNLGGGVGLVAGGAAGQLLYNRRKELMPLLCGLASICTTGPMYYLVNADIKAAGLGPTLAMAALAGLFSAVAAPNVRAAMLNVNEPETRGVALALQSITDDLGRGLGPIIVAAFISRLGGRRDAFNIAFAGWVPSGLLLLCLVFCMRQDEGAVQARLAARLKAAALRDLEGRRSRSSDGASARSSGSGSSAGVSVRVVGLRRGHTNDEQAPELGAAAAAAAVAAALQQAAAHRRRGAASRELLWWRKGVQKLRRGLSGLTAAQPRASAASGAARGSARSSGAGASAGRGGGASDTGGGGGGGSGAGTPRGVSTSRPGPLSPRRLPKSASASSAAAPLADGAAVLELVSPKGEGTPRFRV